MTFPFVVVLGAAYVIGVRRLHARGRSWPATRTAAFLSGLVVVLVATESGLAAYDRVLYSLHVVQHVLLGMVAPLLLVLGAPITLALQAGSRTSQRRILRVLRSTPAQVLTHPLTAWLLFGTSIVTLYFTPLYELSLRNGWFHVATHAYFLLAGCLFLAHVVGLDPIPHALRVRRPPPLRAGVAAVPHLRGRRAAHDEHGHRRRLVRPGRAPVGPAAADRPADRRRDLWVAGELFGLLCIGIVVYQWMSAEERAAARHDRRLDLEAAASQGDR